MLLTHLYSWLPGLLSLLSWILWDTLSRVAQPQQGRPFHISHRRAIRKMSCRLAYEQSDGGILFSCGSSSLVTRARDKTIQNAKLLSGSLGYMQHSLKRKFHHAFNFCRLEQLYLQQKGKDRKQPLAWF